MKCSDWKEAAVLTEGYWKENTIYTRKSVWDLRDLRSISVQLKMFEWFHQQTYKNRPSTLYGVLRDVPDFFNHGLLKISNNWSVRVGVGGAVTDEKIRMLFSFEWLEFFLNIS